MSKRKQIESLEKELKESRAEEISLRGMLGQHQRAEHKLYDEVQKYRNLEKNSEIADAFKEALGSDRTLKLAGADITWESQMVSSNNYSEFIYNYPRSPIGKLNVTFSGSLDVLNRLMSFLGTELA